MIHSIAGELAGGALTDRRPFRAPHHSASMAALVGGGLSARPGEVSLAHHGVLFLDELPEFQPQVARQPAPAARDRRGRDRPRQRPRHLSGALPARRRDEPLPLRPCRRARLRLPARAERALHGALPGPHLRARCSTASTCASRCRPSPPPTSSCRRRPRARPRSPRASPRRARAGRSATRRIGLARRHDQCRRRRRAHRERSRGPDAGRHRAAARGRRRRCGCRPAAFTACCGSRARSPISTAATASARVHIAEALSYRLAGRSRRPEALRPG